MRILVVHSAYRTPGGEDRYVQDQIELLSSRHAVEVLLDRNADLATSASTAARMLYSWSKRGEVDRLIDRFRPDVIHLHNAYPSLGPAVHLAARDRHVPLVMTMHNFRYRCPNGLMYTQGSPCQRCRPGVYAHAVAHDCFPSGRQAAAYASVLWFHRFVLRLEHMVAAFVAPSRFMQTRLTGWGIDADRVHLVRHFAPATRSGGEDSSSGPGSYGIFAGRLSDEKGIDILLRALRLANDPPFRLVGDGPIAPQAHQLAEALGLRRTEFLGRRPHDEVQRLLAEARFLALPSRSEEVAPLAALEAMAVGRPLVVSDVGALPEYVADGAGLVSAAGDETALSRNLAVLMDDDDAWARASAAAMRFARSLTPEAHLSGLEATYRAVAALPGG